LEIAVNSVVKLLQITFLLAFLAFGNIRSLAIPRKTAEANSKDRDSQIKLETSLVGIAYHRRTGKMDILWRDGHKLLGVSSGAQLANGTTLSTTAYSTHTLEGPRDGVDNGAASGNSAAREYTIRSTGPGASGYAAAYLALRWQAGDLDRGRAWS
jgi:alpha-galactosidase